MRRAHAAKKRNWYAVRPAVRCTGGLRREMTVLPMVIDGIRLAVPSRSSHAGDRRGIVAESMRQRVSKKSNAHREKPRPAKARKRPLGPPKSVEATRRASMRQTPEEIDRLMAPPPKLDSRPHNPSWPNKILGYAPFSLPAPDSEFGSLPGPWVEPDDPSLLDYIDDGTPPRTLDEIRADIRKFAESQRQTKRKK
jgi:hypothetical protein